MNSATTIYNSYIGILLPESFNNKLAKIDKSLIPETPHITLYFLGNLEFGVLKKIHESAMHSITQLYGIDVMIEGVDKFKNPNSEVLYLKVVKSGKLNSAHKILEKKLSKYNLNKDHSSFTPHITLKRNKNKINYPKSLNNFKYSFEIGRIALMGRLKEEQGLSSQKEIIRF